MHKHVLISALLCLSLYSTGWTQPVSSEGAQPTEQSVPSGEAVPASGEVPGAVTPPAPAPAPAKPAAKPRPAAGKNGKQTGKTAARPASKPAAAAPAPAEQTLQGPSNAAAAPPSPAPAPEAPAPASVPSRPLETAAGAAASASNGAATAGTGSSLQSTNPGDPSLSASQLQQQGVGRTGRPIMAGPITMQAAMEIGLANSLGVSLASSEVDSARAGTRQAGAGSSVSVSTDFQKVRGEAGRMWDATPTLNTSMMTNGMPENLGMVRARVSYPLWGGAFRERMAVADAAEKQAMAHLALAVRDSARKIRRCYFQVLLERERLQIAQKEMGQREELLGLAQEKLKAGKVAPFVVNRHQTELAAAEQRVNVSRANLTSAEAQLKASLGIEVTSTLNYLDNFEIPPTSGSQEDLLAEALDNRPDLVAARYGVQEGASRVDLAHAEYGPQLNVGASYSTIGNGGLSADSSYTGQYSTGLTLSMPLFDGGNQEAEVQRAEAMKKSRELQLADLELEVTRQVVDVQARYQAAQANQKLSEDAGARADEDLRIAMRRNEVNQGEPTEVLDVLTATTRARNNAVQAAYDANVLYADLLYFTGRF